MEIAYTHTRSRYSDHELRGYLLGDLARALQLDQDHHSYGRLRAYALNVARIAPTVFIAAFIAIFQLPGSCRLTPAERKELDEDYEKGLMRLLASEDQHVQVGLPSSLAPAAGLRIFVDMTFTIRLLSEIGW